MAQSTLFFCNFEDTNREHNTVRKVIGIGETILDILFKGTQPVAAVPGGSCFNTVISLGRTGTPCYFGGYAGTDAVGRQTKDFLTGNGVSTDFFELREGEKSAISLAYLNENGDADYVFYKFTPMLPDDWTLPCLQRDDILVISSYFAICQGTRRKIKELLAKAGENGAIVYYDVNFRSSHLQELETLLPTIHDNFRRSSIVRGSSDDFQIMYGTRDATEIYRQHVASYCPVFICTAGSEAVSVCTPEGVFGFPTPEVTEVVSTVGAGDSFNAGLVYGLILNGMGRNDIPKMDKEQWRSVISYACAFAAEACKSTDNYVSERFITKTLKA